jgi:hypothetical protein
MGVTAREMIPRDYHLITDDGAYPQKLLFIGRSGTAASGNAYQLCNQGAYTGMPLALVTNDPPANAATCGGRPAELKTVETSYAKWYVTLVP